MSWIFQLCRSALPDWAVLEGLFPRYALIGGAFGQLAEVRTENQALTDSVLAKLE